jgi:dTDP-4-dehydrorhamnose 3,5-epimerase/CDP-3, 6-dideoxy-D-glycero-D-glycero-4-hexulose-5-epimerase
VVCTISLLQGRALDVILDIRPTSKTYGKYFSTILESNQNALLLNEGLAHGFKAITDNTIMLYLQNDIYDPKMDLGLHYNSFGFNWECDGPILSDRDKTLQPFLK